MADRGNGGRGEAGRGRGGRDTPGRGGRAGRFGGTPPPPPSAGRGRRPGVGFTPGRGRSPGPGPYYAGAGGRGRGAGSSTTPSPPPPLQQRRPQPFQRSPGAPGSSSSFAAGGGSGRGYGGGPGGSPGVNQGTAFHASSGGVGGGKMFGRGAEAVAFDKDKEKSLLKVGPPAGQRFSAAWLRGLSAFVAWKHQEQAEQAWHAQQAPGRQRQQQGRAPPATPPPSTPPPQQQQGQQEEHTPVQTSSSVHLVAQHGRPPITAKRLGTPTRPPVSVERVPAEEALSSDSSEGSQFSQPSTASTAGSEASPLPAAAVPPAESECEGLEAGEGAAAGEEGGTLSKSSSGSDLGWAAVLAATVAGEGPAASGEGGSGSGTGSQAAAVTGIAGLPDTSDNTSSGVTAAAGEAAVAAEGTSCGGDQPAGSSDGSRHWWPLSEPSLASAQPVAVSTQASGSGTADGGRVQLSVRLERQALTDTEAGMLAEWCCQNSGTADVRKLWLFDNRLTDVGAAAVARIIAAHPGMQEVHLSHNMVTLQGAAALVQALPVPAAAAAAAVGEPQAGGEQPGAPQGETVAETAAASAAAAGAGAGTAGAGAVEAAALPNRPCWLRLEWNRISLEGLMQVLEAQHAQRGLIVDLPSAVRADATPPLCALPPYLVAAAAAAPAAPTPVPAARGSRNTLQYQVERCHARLPWVSCQYQLPSEADVLKAARRGWQQQQQQAQQHAPPPPPPPRQLAEGSSADDGSHQGTATAAATAAQPLAVTAPEPHAATAPATRTPAAGPLLLFPDTSALLPMMGAGANMSVPTFFTLDMLDRLAHQGRFGRGLPAEEQVFIVVTDSVLRQLDGLKNDPGARAAVRRFLGQGLDAYGPAGADFLTVLGAHEGEGLLVEHDAEVAGSRSTDVGTKGQRADHRIVEVALFFQKEVLGSSTSGTASGTASSGSLCPDSFPVLLLSGDNAQLQTARSHGLPAARMSDLAAAQRQLEASLEPGRQLTASLLRAALGVAATTGLATAAGRSLQAEFDEAIAALSAATDALASSQQQLEAVAAAAAARSAGKGEAQDPAAALAAVQQVLVGGAGGGSGSSSAELVRGLRARLAEWQARVRSHQDPSRLLRWAGTS